MSNCCCISAFSTCSKGIGALIWVMVALVVVTLACIMFKKFNVAKHVKGVTDEISSVTKQEGTAPRKSEGSAKSDTLKDLDNFKF